MTVFKRSQNSLGAAILKNALATWPHSLTCLNDVNLDSIHSRSSSTFEDDFWMVGLLLGVSKQGHCHNFLTTFEWHRRGLFGLWRIHLLKRKALKHLLKRGSLVLIFLLYFHKSALQNLSSCSESYIFYQKF